MSDALPPSYVNAPVPIAYARVDDALIVTMIRILGLCWAYDYQRSPALTPEQVAELTGRARSTLYRHLKELRETGWLRVDQAGRRIVIRPLLPRCAAAPGKEAPSTAPPSGQPATDEVLLQALAEIGVENPKRAQLARLGVDPIWVHAWHLWARHRYRQSLTNPVGNIILKLEGGEPPPDEFLRAAQEQSRLRECEQQREEQQAEDPDEDEPAEPEPGPVPAETLRLWASCLSELQLQMTRATFDTWLRGSQVVEVGDGCLTVAVRHVYAVDWLQNRLMPVIQRTVARHARDDVKITFVARA